MEKTNKELNQISSLQSLIVFVVGWLGLQVVAFLYSMIINAFIDVKGLDVTSYQRLNGILEFFIYLTIFVTFIIFAVIKKEETKRVFRFFKEGNYYVKGIVYGILLILISYFYSFFANTIFGEITANENEQGLESVLTVTPVLSFFFVVVFAPICEEITYRYAFFGEICKRNRVLAYVFSALLFGLIHFTIDIGMSREEIINELINLPSYILAGAFLCLVYDNEKNIICNIVAHATNNLFVFVVTLAFMK